MQALSITYFGIIAVSLDVGIVQIQCVVSRFQHLSYRASHNIFGLEGQPPPSLKVPKCLQVANFSYAQCYALFCSVGETNCSWGVVLFRFLIHFLLKMEVSHLYK